jgi:hypothetical protein
VMLSRLAGTLHTEPVVGDTILAQMSGDTITSQLVDLAHDAWRHEHRGPHGEWIGGQPYSGTMTKTRAERIRRIQAAHERQAARAPAMTDDDTLRKMVQEEVARQSVSGISEQEAKKRLAAMPLLPGEDKAMHLNPLPGESQRENLLHEEVMHARVAPYAESKAASVLEAAKQHVAEVNAKIAQQADTKAGKDAKLKFATEGSVAIAGGILAYIGARMGFPDLAVVGASVGPVIIQIIIEFFKRLLWRLPRRTGSSPSTYSPRCWWSREWTKNGLKSSPPWSRTRPSQNRNRSFLVCRSCHLVHLPLRWPSSRR